LPGISGLLRFARNDDRDGITSSLIQLTKLDRARNNTGKNCGGHICGFSIPELAAGRDCTTYFAVFTYESSINKGINYGIPNGMLFVLTAVRQAIDEMPESKSIINMNAP
jgi:hypothetical protein